MCERCASGRASEDVGQFGRLPNVGRARHWRLLRRGTMVLAKSKLERSFGPINLTPDTVKWTLPVVNGMKCCTGAVVGRSRTNWGYRAVLQR
ncbi:hypothetical protein E1A91_D10G243000v1 [Gossypium mustelinum]|uniref:Uncharacterized protein n=1 Tax=Gossypium mustelinum TaxID=34275 RepID=A0A5D2TCN0_GOSMU|nr:hypothetical protein E1A91_D10G243000v1 [Gossypium mustelinum]